MKNFSNIFYKILFIVNIIYIILAFIIFRRFDYLLPFFRLEIGAILISLILSTAYSVFKSEKGNAVINIIIAYVLVIPSMFVVRLNFGRYLFRSLWILYIIFIIFGCIYALALLLVQKKHKEEIDQLNKLLKTKEDKEKTPDED
ncbi:MAG: hypothetical protein ACLFPM_02600 [Candidatus Izemoplasmatales bacterium]